MQVQLKYNLTDLLLKYYFISGSRYLNGKQSVLFNKKQNKEVFREETMTQKFQNKGAS